MRVPAPARMHYGPTVASTASRCAGFRSWVRNLGCTAAESAIPPRRFHPVIHSRQGQTGSGSFYGRTVMGLTTFFVANSILGAINPTLGAVGLLVEFAVALMGIGALVQTGFGRSGDGLGRFGRFSGSDLG